MKKLNFVFLTIVLALVFVTGSVVLADIPGWRDAPNNPPQENADAPINVSAQGQGKMGPLTIGNLLWAKTKILIGGDETTVPQAKLDVRGDGYIEEGLSTKSAVGCPSGWWCGLRTWDIAAQSGRFNGDVKVAGDVCLDSGICLSQLGGGTPPLPPPPEPGVTQYRLTINPSAGGHVTGGVSGTYPVGTDFSLTAVADSGWTFDKSVTAKSWNVNEAKLSGNPLSVYIRTKDMTVTPTFKQNAPPPPPPASGPVTFAYRSDISKLNNFYCERDGGGGGVVTMIDSSGSNARDFRATCSDPKLEVNGAAVSVGPYQYSTDWKHDLAGGFDCPAGQVMTGMESRTNGPNIEWLVQCGKINNGKATVIVDHYIGPVLPTNPGSLRCGTNQAITSIQAYFPNRDSSNIAQWKVACSTVSIP